MMNLEQTALIADIVQAVAVVTTLLFVGLQVRHNTRIAKMSAAQVSVQLLTENLGRVTDNPELAELLIGSRGELDDLSEADRLRVSNFLAAAFRNLEVLHAFRRNDIYEEELWQGAAARLRRMLTNPRIQDWWIDTKDLYASSFQTHVAAEIEALRVNAPPDTPNTHTTHSREDGNPEDINS